MSSVVVEWLLRPETLAWASAAGLFLCAARPIVDYLDREVPVEGEMDS